MSPKLCVCDSQGCGGIVSRNPKTGANVRGRYVSPRDLYEHVQADAINEALRDEETRGIVSTALYTATLQGHAASAAGFHGEGPDRSASSDGSTHDLPPLYGPDLSKMSAAAERVFAKLQEHEVEILRRAGEWRSRPRLGAPDIIGIAPPPFPLLEVENWFFNAKSDIRELQSEGSVAVMMQKSRLVGILNAQLAQIDEERAEWDSSVRHNRSHPPVMSSASGSYSTDVYMVNPLTTATSTHAIILFFIVVLNLIFRLPRRGCKFCLAIISILLEDSITTLSRSHSSILPRDIHTIINDIPTDPRLARKVLNLQPAQIIYAACPSCSHLHPPSPASPGSERLIYPSTCQNVLFSKICGTQLLVMKQTRGRRIRRGMQEPKKSLDNLVIGTPIRPFAYAHLKDAVAELMSRPGLEKLMDEAWGATSGSMQRDIWDSTEIRNFDGPDGKLFSLKPPGEARLVFSLSVDWFNPFGNARRKAASVGMISMTCLNLPPSIRYKAENMHLVAIVPGPKESDAQPFLAPLVDELQQFWNPGVQFSTTHDYPTGRLVRCVLIPLVCDMPAARKIIGFTNHNGTRACPFCHCTRADLQKASSAEDLDHRQRTREEWVKAAMEWKDAPSHSVRTELAKAQGVKWSELLRLPYWDPTRFAVVDPMHNLFLGLLQYHFRHVLGMDIKVADESSKAGATVHAASDAATRADLAAKAAAAAKSRFEKATAHLGARNWKALKNTPKIVLDRLCRQNSLLPDSKTPGKQPTKEDMVAELRKWKENPSSVTYVVRDPEPPPPPPKQTAKVGTDTLLAIRRIIADILMPLWVGRLPANLGEAGAGTLKADQWRTAGTVCLPIALIHLWSPIPAQAQLLTNLMDLVTAVQLASRRSTSADRAQRYTFYMQRYILGLAQLTPTVNLKPNHHAALHLGNFLTRFGPVHGWWAFPSERLIGGLEKHNTNNRFGQMELTIFNSHHEASRLRSLIQKDDCPKVVRKCFSALRATLEDGDRGTLESDIATFDFVQETSAIDRIQRMDQKKVKRLDDQHYAALCELVDTDHLTSSLARNVQQLDHILHKGARLSTRDISFPNSLVMFDCGSNAAPGQITMIFLHERALRDGSRICETFLALQPYLERSGGAYDPFSTLDSSFGAGIWSDDLDSGALLVRLDDVICHYASWSFQDEGKNLQVVWPLDRVRLPLGFVYTI